MHRDNRRELAVNGSRTDDTAATSGSRPSILRRRWPQRLLSAALVLFAAWVFHEPALRGAAHWLDVGAPLQSPVDAAYILGGDAHVRTFAAIALVRDNRARFILISAPASALRPNALCAPCGAELVEQILQSEGMSATPKFRLPLANDSTVGEAEALHHYLHEHPNCTVAVVTNDYHTRRARMLFQRQLMKDEFARVSFVSCSSGNFRADNWWKNRSGRSTYLTEFGKLIVQSVYHAGVASD